MDDKEELRKSIDSPQYDIWLGISHMCKYQTVGIQQYICRRLECLHGPIHLLPQLIQAFLSGGRDDVSYPMYGLLRSWAARSQGFSCALYFHLKSYVVRNTSVKSVACYFLICDILNMDRSRSARNILSLELRQRHKVPLNRTIGTGPMKRGYPVFKGIFIFLVRAVSWPVSTGLYEKLRDYGRAFLRTYSLVNMHSKFDLGSGCAFTGTPLRRNISFLEALVGISDRLKRLPKLLRQKGLETEIRLLNCNLPARVTLPFYPAKLVLTARIEESFVLDSAENSPFVVVFEVADRLPQYRRPVSEELCRASLLMQQLSTVGGINPLNEMNGNLVKEIDRALSSERERDEEELALRDGGGKETMRPRTARRSMGMPLHRRSTVETEGHRVSGDASEQSDIIFFDNASINEVHFKDEEDVKNAFYSTNSISGVSLNSDAAIKEGGRNAGKKRILEFPERSYSATVLLHNESVPREDSADGSRGHRRHKSWMLKRAELRKTSLFRESDGWSIRSVIVKSGNELLGEIIAYQMLAAMGRIWREEGKPIWVYPYQIYLVSSTAGIIETVNDATSIHRIKKSRIGNARNYPLREYFMELHGSNTPKYKCCVRNFLYSLVGYSLATYLLQIKDRHNGNIMVDREGHIIHVDFGFILGAYPGFYCVEMAPFKMCKEYLDLLGDLLDEFKLLFLEGFLALRRHSEGLCRIIETMVGHSGIECLNARELSNFRIRLKLDLSDREIEEYVLHLINRSLNSMGTGLYDSYQYFSHGYL
jgi:phosphatidylinositol 4-kinase B